MAYFKPEFLKFFQDLSKNNNKDWFHGHKSEYETFVKKPMRAFVEEVIADMQKIDPSIDAVASKSIGRINRDIRFAKDKTPYNTHLFAHIMKGPKEKALPTIAFRFAGFDSGIMTGFYKVDKERLAKLRANIQNNTEVFQKLVNDPKLKAKFGDIQGEALKRIPKEYQETFEKEPLIANKQFYLIKHMKPEFVLSDDLKETILDYYKTSKPLIDFLSR